MHWSEIWEGTSAKAVAIRTLLTPASWLYSIGWRSYAALYSTGLKKAAAPHNPIICVGGLTAGGSGKSPVVLHIASLLTKQGHNVVISSSGYGSPSSEAASVAPEGPLDASKWGDEAAMIRWLMPEVPLIVGRRRVLAAELCHQHFPEAIMLMDDGFQHLPLAKQVKILLLDNDNTNRRCLPAGPYREPYSYRRRADIVIPDHFKVHVARLQLRDRNGVLWNQGAQEIYALCALGQPQKFLESLAQNSWKVIDSRLLPDHDPLTGGNLFDGWPISAPIVVTAKDWVKLQNRPDLAERKIWIADYKVAIEPQDEFRAWIENKLNECIKNPS